MKPPIRGRTEPQGGLLRRLDSLFRAAFPSLITALLLVLAVVPMGGPGMLMAMALPCVFFWTIFRPAAMPAPAVFGLGLLHDLLALAPLGVGVLALLVAHGVTLRMRDLLVRQSFLVVWMVFCAFSAGTAMLCWLLTALLNLQVPPMIPGVHQAAVCAGIYPVLAWIMTRAHRAMQVAEA